MMYLSHRTGAVIGWCRTATSSGRAAAHVCTTGWCSRWTPAAGSASASLPETSVDGVAVFHAVVEPVGVVVKHGQHALDNDYFNRMAALNYAIAHDDGRLRAMDVALADSMFLDVTGRTAKRLLEMSEGNDSFLLPVTQEELAGWVGASRERVNKAIAAFIRLGWLEQRDRHYTILKRQSLEDRAS